MDKDATSKKIGTSYNMIMRKAKPNDLDAIVNLYHETIDYLNEQGIKQWNKHVYPTRQSALDAQRSGSLYCCLMGDNFVGTFIMNEEQATQYNDLKWKYSKSKILVLHTLITKPSESGRGVAKSMMKFIMTYAQDNEYESIRLDVFPDNKTAVALYHLFGFEFVGKVYFDFKEAGYEWYDCYEKLISLSKK